MTVLLSEGILWLIFPQGWEPEIDVAYHQDFPGLKKEIRFRKNGLGLRSLTIDRWEKPKNAIRVIFTLSCESCRSISPLLPIGTVLCFFRPDFGAMLAPE